MWFWCFAIPIEFPTKYTAIECWFFLLFLFLFFLFNTPDYFTPMFGPPMYPIIGLQIPLGVLWLVGAFVWQVLGGYVIYRIIDIKV